MGVTEPRVAIDFDGIVMRTAFFSDEYSRPIERDFLSVFTLDENGAAPQLIDDWAATTKDEAERLFALNVGEIGKDDERAGSETRGAWSTETALAAALTKIRTYWAENYSVDKNLSACVLVLRKRNELFETLRRAAAVAGFSQIEYRNKAICAAEAFFRSDAEFSQYVRNEDALVCNVEFADTTITLVTRKRFGVEAYDKRSSGKANFTSINRPNGYSAIVDKLIQHAIKNKEKSTSDVSPATWRRLRDAFAVSVALRGPKFWSADSDERTFFGVGGWELSASETTIRRYRETFVKKYSQVLIESIVKMNAKPSVVVLTGAGGAIHGLREALHAALGVQTVVSFGPERGAAFGCADLLTTPIFNTPQTREEIDFCARLDEAREGDSNAALAVARAYFEGKGAPKSFEDVAYWTQKAAQKDNVEAVYYWGKCHAEGWGVAPDEERAHKLYLQAAQLGHTKSQLKVAQHYLTYLKGETEDRQAYYWLKLAAEGGEEKAKRLLEKLDAKRGVVGRRQARAAAVEKNQKLLDHLIGSGVSVAIFSAFAYFKTSAGFDWRGCVALGFVAASGILFLTFLTIYLAREKKITAR